MELEVCLWVQLLLLEAEGRKNETQKDLLGRKAEKKNGSKYHWRKYSSHKMTRFFLLNEPRRKLRPVFAYLGNH